MELGGALDPSTYLGYKEQDQGSCTKETGTSLQKYQLFPKVIKTKNPRLRLPY